MGRVSQALATGARTVSTGQAASRTTFSATEPNRTCRNPLIPVVAMTIKSARSSSAMRTISPPASSCPITVRTFKLLGTRC